LGKTSNISVYLSAAHQHFKKVRDERNEHINYHGRSDVRLSGRVVRSDRKNQAKLRKIAHRTTPADETSLGKAIDELNNGSSLPILDKDEQFPGVMQMLALLCSHYKLRLY
jgi:hypothetical protein